MRIEIHRKCVHYEMSKNHLDNTCVLWISQGERKRGALSKWNGVSMCTFLWDALDILANLIGMCFNGEYCCKCMSWFILFSFILFFFAKIKWKPLIQCMISEWFLWMESLYVCTFDLYYSSYNFFFAFCQ